MAGFECMHKAIDVPLDIWRAGMGRGKYDEVLNEDCI